VFDRAVRWLSMVTGSRPSLVVSGGSESFCVLRGVISAIRDQAHPGEEHHVGLARAVR
jgi:hypothetical protein